MYFLETGLGEVFKPRQQKTPPTKQPPVKVPQQPPKEGWISKDGHRRFCPAPSGRSLSCDLILKVRFHRYFDSFLREVEEAYGRWMARPTARILVKKLEKDLKQWHGEMLYFHALDGDPMLLTVGLYYRKSNGSWLVHDSSLRQWQRLIDI